MTTLVPETAIAVAARIQSACVTCAATKPAGAASHPAYSLARPRFAFIAARRPASYATTTESFGARGISPAGAMLDTKGAQPPKVVARARRAKVVRLLRRIGVSSER